MNASTPSNGLLPTRLARILASLSTLLLPCGPLFGQAVTWNGGGDGVSWHDPLNWSSLAVPGSSNDVVIPAGAASVVHYQGAQPAVRSLANAATLWVRGGASGNAMLSVAGDLTNHGTLRIETVSWAWDSSVSLGGRLVNEPGGVVQVNPGTGGGRFFTGGVLNRGALNVAEGASCYAYGAGQVFRQEAGTVNAAGRLTWADGHFEFAGGHLTGTVVVRNGSLDVGGSAGASTILCAGSTMLLANRGADVTVRVAGGLYGQATLTTAEGATNDGRILMESWEGGWDSILVIGGGNFVNGPIGIVEANPGTGGGRGLSGHYINRGLTVATNGGFLSLSGIYQADGGRLDGAIALINGEVRVTAPAPAPTTIPLRGSVTLTTDNLPNTTLWVQGGGSGSGLLTAPASFTNHGNIRLESISGAWPSDLIVATGVLRNAASGRLEVNPGSGGPRNLTAGLDNEGTLAIASGTSLYLHGAGLTWNQRSGTVAAEGPCTWAGGSFNLLGGVLSGDLYLRNADIAVEATATHPATVVAAGACRLRHNLSSQTTLWVRGGLYGDAVLTTHTNGSVNLGTLRLQSTGGAWPSVIVVPDAGLTNGPGGLIASILGDGGPRYCSGLLVNQGTVVATNGPSLNLFGIYQANGGVLEGAIALVNGEVRVTQQPPTPTTIRLRGAVTLTTDNLPNTTLWVQGGGSGDGRLTAPASFTNHGIIRLESISGAWPSDLVVTDGSLRNATTGAIEVKSGAGGPRTLTAGLDNSGAITIESGTSLYIQGAERAWHQRGGVVDAQGRCTWASGAFVLSGGAIHGELLVRNGSIAVAATATNVNTVIAAAGSALLDNLSPTTTIWVRGGGLYGHATLTTQAGGSLNLGVMRLESTEGSWSSVVNSPGAGLTNGPTADIQSFAGSAGARELTGTLVNQGFVSAEPGYYLDLFGTIEEAGGRFEGPVRIRNSLLRITASPLVPTTMLLWGENTLATDNLANVNLLVQGGGSGHATLHWTHGGNNFGGLALDSINGTWSATVNVAPTILRNQSGGLVEILPGTGGGRAVNAALINHGELRANLSASVSAAGAHHANHGAIRLANAALTFGGASLTNHAGALLAGTGTFNAAGLVCHNAGRIRPGGSPGRLTFTGNVIQSGSAEYDLEIGGPTAATEFDQVVISGAALLAGTVNLSLAGGYLPDPTNVFPIVTFGSLSGAFDTFTGLTINSDLGFEPVYTATQLQLRTLASTNLGTNLPSILSQPASQTVEQGTPVEFRVAANGSPPLRYQWRFNGDALPGETRNTLAIASAGTNHTGDYTVVITNTAGAVTSAVATLIVTVPADLVFWDGGGDGSSWHDPLNWSGDFVPTATNRAVADLGGGITITVANNATVRSLRCEESLLISGGAVTVTEGDSWVNGALTVNASRGLAVQGSNTTFIATGPATINSAVLTARNGARLDLPTAHAFTSGQLVLSNNATATMSALTNVNLSRFLLYNGATFALPPSVTSYNSSGGMGINEQRTIMLAQGAGTRLDLSSLQTLEAVFSGLGGLRQLITVSAGAEIDLSGLTIVTGGGSGANGGGPLEFRTDATGLIRLGGLAQFDGRNAGILVNCARPVLELPRLAGAIRTQFQLPAGGEVSAAQLASLQLCRLTIPDAARFAAPLLTAFANSTLSLSGGGAFEHGELTSVDLSRFILSAGATYTLPASIRSFSSSDSFGVNEQRTLFSASDAGTRLDLSSLTNLTAVFSGLGGLRLLVTASGGGEIDLSGVRSISGGGSGVNGGGPFEFRSDASGKVLLTALETANGTGAGVLINLAGTNALGGGELSLANAHLTVPTNSLITVGALELLSAAHLSGVGLLEGDVLNAGVVRPGTSPGQLTILGNYTQTATGACIAEVGGPTPGAQFDQLVVTGHAALAGTLDVRRINNYEPDLTNTFRILDSGSREGQFSSVVGADAGASVEFVPAYDPSGVTLGLIFATGPSVVAASPAGVIAHTFDHFILTFSEPLLASSFTAAKVALTGPAGPITVSAPQLLSNTVWRVSFAAQTLAGEYTLAVGPDVRDLAGNPMNQNDDALNGTPDDRFVLTVTVPDPVDFAVTAVFTPDTALVGTPVALAWTVANESTNSATGNRTDAVYLSTDRTVGNDVWLGNFTSAGELGPGQSSTVTNLLMLPPGSSGTRYFIVVADSPREWFESSETNNTFISTNATIVAAADLTVASVTASRTSAQFGETVTVTWVVRNNGSAAAAATWRDRVYLSPSSTVTAQSIALPPDHPAGPLAAGASYTNSSTVTLPNTPDLSAGTYYLVVLANANNGQAEANVGNNSGSRLISLTVPPKPDLVVADVLAPATAAPGVPFVLAWAVTNQGAAAASGLWAESVVWSNAAGGLRELARFNLTNGLAAGATVWRTQMVTIPIEGPAGAVWLGAQVDTLGEVAEEAEANNLAFAHAPTTVPLTLTLQPPFSQIAEDSPTPVFTCLVARNGDTASALTVLLSSSDTNEITVPVSVVIPAGQSSAGFPAEVRRDHVVDGAKLVTLSATADSFAAASATLTVLDADLPRLALRLATNAVWEGALLPVTVARELASTNALPVVVESSSPGQFSPPTFVTIPAGTTAAEFSVLAVDDTLVEGPLNYTLTATAAGYELAATNVWVLDNDLPNVVVTLASDTVSEGAGPHATVGTVTRSLVSPRALAVDLESTNPAAALVPARVLIPANQTAVSFPVAAVDDDQVNPPKTTFIQPFVVGSGGNTRLLEGAGAWLTVADDDGPALGLVAAHKVVAEGLDPATTLTLSRNTPATNALTVVLHSSRPAEATVPPEAVIPMGATTVLVPVTSIADGVADGNQTVVFTASAPGFVSGSETITVTDTDLPDVISQNLTVPSMADTDTFVSVSYRVLNQGLGPVTSSFLVRVYLARDAFGVDRTLATQASFGGNLPPGQFFEQALQVRTPLAAGDYWVVVEVDAAQQIAEILEDNNVTIAATPIQVRAAYGAWVQTSITTALANTPVPMSGRATNAAGAGVPGKLVNVHILARGTERVISALTDSQGDYSLTWQPLPGEAGWYQLFATHPGVSAAPVQATFRLVGLKASPAHAAISVIEGQTREGTIMIENLSDLPLTGVTASVASAPPGMQAEASLAGAGQIPGEGFATLSYSLAPVSADASGNVVLRVASAEGATVEVTLAVSVEALRPRLVAAPGSLLAGMARGRQTSVAFTLANEGGLATGPITVALPPAPWLALATPNPLPSLPPGGATEVTLLLTPAADLTLGAYTGSLALNSGSASLAVPFNFRALSDATGDLLVSAVNELTYYAEGAPKLAGASVVVRDAVTRTNVAAGVTDTNGQFFVPQLAEGYYELEVSAERHTTYRNTHLLLAGQTNELSAFLSRQTVTYIWTVEPVEIEDRYQITIDATFEANVPLPVVTVHPPVIDLALLTAPETQVLVTITNHGLIAAEAARLSFPTHPAWQFDALISELGTLPARSALTIPVRIRQVTPGGRAPKDAGGACHLAANVCWELVCGPLRNTYCASIALPNARSGCGSAGGPFHITGGGGGALGPVYAGPAYAVNLVCDPECLLLAALGCIPGPIGCFFSGYSCGQGVADKPDDPMSYVNCAIGAAGCLFPPASMPACFYSIASCFVGPAPAGRGFTGDALAPYRAGVRSMLDSFNELTGAPDSVWFNAQSGPLLGDWLERLGAATQTNSPAGRLVSAAEAADLLGGPLPEGVSAAEAQRFLERWNRTVNNWSAGLLRPQDAPPGESTDFADFPTYRDQVLASIAAQQTAEQNGYSDPINAIVETARFLAGQGQSGGVCARVQLRTEQEAVLTRDAFRATLEINNGDDARMESIRVSLTVHDANGVDRTGLFGIRPPDLVGLSGADGDGILAGGSTGTARWALIPTSDAAPTSATQYFVSGRFAYRQSGAQLSVPLAPVAITVLPAPRLQVRYFHERDVFSDDPFTEPVEPAIPFNLAVMIENRGFGAARNFRLTSAQPQIVENDKGLLIDFQIIATEVAGQNMVPSLTANFGNIGPGQTVIGRWLMTSTLQGLFTDYSATFQHLDALDGVQLSVLEEVTIHEMIRLVQAGGAFEDGQPDFLVNDIPDLRDLPDTLWLSDGTSRPVTVVESATHDGPPAPARLEISLSAPMPGGWAYLRVPDPAEGAWRLARVRRSDGGVIGVGTNAWITDRTFLGLGRRPTYERILHLLDYDSPGHYTLTYEALPAADILPPVSQVLPLPAQSYARIPVSWTGADDPGGSGIAGYDIFVSENGGPFMRWLVGTTLNGSIYVGTLGHSYAFYSVATDRAGNRESPPGAPDAFTTVLLTNRPPLFAPVANQAIDEGIEFVLQLSATDPDPADVLRFSLMSAPPGMTLHPVTGLLRWTTGEANGPSTNVIVARAVDNGDPPLAAMNTFTLIVNEVNQPPTLAPIADFTINEGQLLTFTNLATDPDLPPNQLTFSLRTPAPAGAAVNPTNGICTWRPSAVQGPSTNRLAIIVTDDGTPSLSATQQFTVIVRDVLSDFTLRLGRTNLLAGERGGLPVTLRSSLDLTNLTLLVEAPSARLVGLQLRPLAGEVTGLSLVSTGANLSQLTFQLDPALAGASERALAALEFLAASNYPSAIVPLDARSLLARKADGGAVTNGTAVDGRVIIVGREPVLESVLAPQPRLLLYGRPGAGYALQSRTNAVSTGPWTEWQRFTLTDRVAAFDSPPVPGLGSFWRAYEFRAEPPRLTLEPGPEPQLTLRLAGWPGVAYDLETTTALGLPWQTWTNFTLTNAVQTFPWPAATGPQRFFRGTAREP